MAIGYTPIFNAPGITAERRRAFILREMAQVMGIEAAELQQRLSVAVAKQRKPLEGKEEMHLDCT